MTLLLLVVAVEQAPVRFDNGHGCRLSAVEAKFGCLTLIDNLTKYEQNKLAKTDTVIKREHDPGKEMNDVLLQARVRFLASHIAKTLPLKTKFALCHGSRLGVEQKLFRQLLPGEEVWYTSASVEPCASRWSTPI